VGLAFVVLVLFLIALAIYPPLTFFVVGGLVVLVLVVCATICLGLYDSAREALDYADS